LPDRVNAEELEIKARKHGVLIESGSVFFSDPTKGSNWIRLGFSSIPSNRIPEGLARLAALIND
ncbi:MAG: hypothetical protein DWQ08_11445, partial [Proteobacteria bacterium]